MKEAVLTQQEALVVASAITTGCGQVQATHQLNAWRKKKGLSPISRKSVRTVLARLGVLRFRCCGKKTGSKDPTSAWSMARKAQVQQWSETIWTDSDSGLDGMEGPPAGGIYHKFFSFFHILWVLKYRLRVTLGPKVQTWGTVSARLHRCAGAGSYRPRQF